MGRASKSRARSLRTLPGDAHEQSFAQVFCFIPLGSRQRLPKASKKSKQILRISYIKWYVSLLEIIESSLHSFLPPDLTMFHKRCTVTPKLQWQRQRVLITGCPLQRGDNPFQSTLTTSCPLSSLLASNTVPGTVSVTGPWKVHLERKERKLLVLKVVLY